MTHIVFHSVARRLDAGTYSPAVARALRTSAAAPASSPWPAVAPYAGCALLGALLALAFVGSP